MAYFKIVFIFVIPILAIFFAVFTNFLQQDYPTPHFPRDQWWGKGHKKEASSNIENFEVNVSEQVITDLHTRLDQYLNKSQTPPLEGIGFQYGFNTDYLQAIVKYWRNNYDWYSRQAKINSFPQFTTMINGLKIHFVRVKPKNLEGKTVLPLLLLHGWPGSFWEFHEMIPLLTTSNDKTDFVFEVIVPSLPGFGFSEGSAKPLFSPIQYSIVMNNLMERIGFEHYYVQGGDWGAEISNILGILYPERVLGAHLNLCMAINKKALLLYLIGSVFPSFVVEPEHAHLMYPIKEKLAFVMEETGYFHIQSTKPDTLGVALQNSPVGLAAYVLEKFSTGTNRAWRQHFDGGFQRNKISTDVLLDNIMIYWISNSITTSMRIYSEGLPSKNILKEVPLRIPTACARFHNDILFFSEKILRFKYLNLIHISDYPNAGHFAALEASQDLANDIFIAVKKMRKV